ncbi:MAG: cytochrome c [Cyclobacteriaceae bacterium]|nr:cytochrome c [Cyclobacteriaceae bacterium]MDH4296264.1 cytochrome c [Cyclobacteriaceae bacterium]MDH5249939.1 cytochrome c [Cyclobacteriaceae bacterium]
MRRFYFLAPFFLAVAACTSPKQQGDDSSISGTPQVSIGIAEKGEVLYKTCAACHGVAGEGSLAVNAPALANGESWYLYRQLINFRKGIRGTGSDTLGLQMATIAKTLTDSSQVADVVAYISSMTPVALETLITGDIGKGERIYQTVCGSCHGAGAKGNEKMNAPRLNRLDDWYIKRQVHNFKNAVRGSHPDDILGEQMIAMAALVTNEKALDDLIAYIRSTDQTVTE